MTSKELTILAEIFPSCTFEAISGLYIYDKNGVFICAYLNDGFSLNLEYKYANDVQERLEQYGYTCWGHQIMQETELQELLDTHR